MILPVSNIQNVLRTYGRQLHVARLNSEVKRTVTQGQVDKVEISEEGRKMLEQRLQTTAPDLDKSGSKPVDEFESETIGTSETPDTVEEDDFFF